MRSTTSYRSDRVAALAAVLFAATAGPALAQERPCEPPGVLTRISGKISTSTVSLGETLGSGSVLLVGRGKMICGLQGRAFLGPDGGVAGFIHTIVCDDDVRLPSGDIVHSQIVAATRFDGIPEFQACGIPGVDAVFGSFREISEPQSGRGLFSPTGGGRIAVEGALNCAGSAELVYDGEACVIR